MAFCSAMGGLDALYPRFGQICERRRNLQKRLYAIAHFSTYRCLESDTTQFSDILYRLLKISESAQSFLRG